MDQQQKQKLMLGIVAVLALGAGGYYFVLRDSGESNQSSVTEGPAERRVRTTTETPETVRKERPKEAAPKEAVAVERREREEEETTEVTRKAKPRSGEKSTKKKEVQPAA